MSELRSKLRPARFPGMSPLMAAIVGFVLGESFTNPEIAEIAVSEMEGIVYFRKAGEPLASTDCKAFDDLRENWNRLLDVAGLGPKSAGRRYGSSSKKSKRSATRNSECRNCSTG